MLDYVKETPDVLKTNIEQYTTLVDPLMNEVQQKESLCHIHLRIMKMTLKRTT